MFCASALRPRSGENFAFCFAFALISTNFSAVFSYDTSIASSSRDKHTDAYSRTYRALAQTRGSQRHKAGSLPTVFCKPKRRKSVGGIHCKLLDRHPALAVLHGDPPTSTRRIQRHTRCKSICSAAGCCGCCQRYIEHEDEQQPAKWSKTVEHDDLLARCTAFDNNVFCQHVKEPVLGVQVALHAHLRRLE
jgi:hypothetical protein